MSYNVDKLFRFLGAESEYVVKKYLKKDDPSVTELEIPAEYNGKPVTIIAPEAFARSYYLKSVKLPRSVGAVNDAAFKDCTELERVEFNSEPFFRPNVFNGCPKLAPETVVMGLVRSTDITQSIPISDPASLNGGGFMTDLPGDCFRPDVFELLLKNNCFRNFSLHTVLSGMIDNNKPELLPVAEEHGMLDDAELVDKLINSSVEMQKTEITAYLLELKKRKFGFNGGDNFEL